MKKKLMMILAALLLLLIAVALYGSLAARRMIEERRHDVAGLALDIGGYSLGIFSASLSLKEIKIYPAGKEEPQFLLASAEKLFISVAPFDLLRGKLRAKKVELKKPEINYVITGRKSANWDALDLGERESPAKGEGKKGDEAAGKGWELVVDDVEIEDGRVLYRNDVNGQNLELREVDISIEDIRAARKEGELPTGIEMEGKVGGTGGKLSVEGMADLLGDSISFDVAGGLSSTPITAFSSFYAGSVPFEIAAGSIEVSSKGKAVKNLLTSSHHATIYGLEAGGKGELINQFLRLNRAPIEVDTAVSGDLSTGKFSVSAELSRGIADEILRRVSASLPEKALERVKKIAPIKEGIRNIFKR
ncbi:MAG: AsmA family protein [bacterium ADurb.Bin270]|nr:MAG: AsmA family protein [bacterium ADurb.Bin270]